MRSLDTATILKAPRRPVPHHRQRASFQDDVLVVVRLWEAGDFQQFLITLPSMRPGSLPSRLAHLLIIFPLKETQAVLDVL